MTHLPHECDVTAADIDRQREHLCRALAAMVRDTASMPADPGFLVVLQKLDALRNIIPTRREPEQPVDVGWNERTGERVTLPPRRRNSPEDRT